MSGDGEVEGHNNSMEKRNAECERDFKSSNTIKMYVCYSLARAHRLADVNS